MTANAARATAGRARPHAGWRREYSTRRPMIAAYPTASAQRLTRDGTLWCVAAAYTFTSAPAVLRRYAEPMNARIRCGGVGGTAVSAECTTTAGRKYSAATAAPTSQTGASAGRLMPGAP